MSAVARDRLKISVTIRLFESHYMLNHKCKLSISLAQNFSLFIPSYLILHWWFLTFKMRLTFK